MLIMRVSIYDQAIQMFTTKYKASEVHNMCIATDIAKEVAAKFNMSFETILKHFGF